MHDERILSKFQGCLNGVRKPAPDVRPHDEAVNHDLNGVKIVARQRGRFVQKIFRVVDPDSLETFASGFGQEFLVFALLAPDKRGEDLDLLAFRQGEDRLNDLLWSLGSDGGAAFRTVGDAQLRKEHS